MALTGLCAVSNLICVFFSLLCTLNFEVPEAAGCPVLPCPEGWAQLSCLAGQLY